MKYRTEVLSLRQALAALKGMPGQLIETDTEDQVQLLLEFFRQPLAAKCADHPAQGHGQYIANHANGHLVFLFSGQSIP